MSFYIINYTPHDVVICNQEGKETVRFLAEKGRVARLYEEDLLLTSINGIAVKQKTYGQIMGLPEETSGTYYIVSLPLLQANAAATDKRRDLLAPDTGKGVVRNEKGDIVGTKNFVSL
jgi:hypothetical protein